MFGLLTKNVPISSCADVIHEILLALHVCFMSQIKTHITTLNVRIADIFTVAHTVGNGISNRRRRMVLVTSKMTSIFSFESHLV